MKPTSKLVTHERLEPDIFQIITGDYRINNHYIAGDCSPTK